MLMPEREQAGAGTRAVAAIALGSNLSSVYGAPADNLREAVRRVGSLGRVSAVSSFRATAPVGFVDQPDFVNAALLIETALGPEALMEALLRIEAGMGRVRTGMPDKGPRSIDLDLLLYGAEVMQSGILTLPHPAMAGRAFVLEPLAEIAPGMVHPVLKRTVGELLGDLGGEE